MNSHSPISLALAAALLLCTPGCGLALAEPSAAIDPASTQPTTRPTLRLIGKIEHPAIQECSGIVASRRHPGLFWVHNDSGHAPSLFAITREGKLIAEFAVAAVNVDWEDIAIDSNGRLYIGDIGNNSQARRQIQVHQLQEPDPNAPVASPPPRLPVLRTWTLAYPGQPFDAEALFVYGDYGYIISKLFLAGRATLYRFPLTAPADAPITLEKVTPLPIFSPVTAADLRADGKQLAVLSVTGLNLFDLGDDFTALVKSEPLHVRYLQPIAEGVCFETGGVLIATENRELLSAQTAQPAQSPR